MNENNVMTLELPCDIDGTTCQVSIRTVDMDGWLLYECFLSQDLVVHFSQDEGETGIEWINMGEQIPHAWLTALEELLSKKGQKSGLNQ